MAHIDAGMDVEEVRELGRLLQARADDLRAMAADLDRKVRSAEWTGSTGERFKGDWWPRHRHQIDDVAEQIKGFGRCAQNNADEQERVSGSASSGGGASSGAGAGAAASGGFGAIAGLVGGGGTALSVLGDVKGIRAAAVAGDGISYLGYAASGVTIGADLARGDYHGAAFEAVFTGGDVAADAMKSTGTPLGYAGGAATQAWTEVGREARNVDWSAQGWRDIQQASLGDWTGAVGYAASEMPLRLVKIFGF